VVGIGYVLYDTNGLQNPPCLQFGSYRGIFTWR